MATIYEVSELAGVSLATVSRVMNDSSKVSPKTRKKVEAAMKELGYRPNVIAQSLASNRSNSVGVLGAPWALLGGRIHWRRALLVAAAALAAGSLATWGPGWLSSGG